MNVRQRCNAVDAGLSAYLGGEDSRDVIHLDATYAHGANLREGRRARREARGGARDRREHCRRRQGTWRAAWDTRGSWVVGARRSR